MQNRFLHGLCTFVLTLTLSLAAAGQSDDLSTRDNRARTLSTIMTASVDEPSFDIWAPENRKALGAGALMLIAAATGLSITVSGLKNDMRKRRKRYTYRSRRDD